MSDLKKLPSSIEPDVLDQFGVIVGRSNVLTDTAECIAYGYDNSKLQAIPQAVLLPESDEQLEIIIGLCRQQHIPVIARGRGTGTTGATVPDQGGIIISFERMNRIIEIDVDNRFARVQPGVLNQQLQEALAAEGFFWPPDPTSAANCTIGGNLAYNSAGPRAVKYGTPRENTLGLTAVDGTGKKFRTGVKTSKGVVGYDLTRLMIGSEGTLGIITEATLKILPLPPAKITLQAGFDSINAAARAVSAIMSQPETPYALELMDEAAIEMVRNFSDLGLNERTKAILMIELDGNESSLQNGKQAIESACQIEGLVSLESADTPEAVEKLWKTRKALSPALRNIAPAKINEDVVVPVSNIPSLIEGLETISRQYAIQIVNFGHAGNGNIHVNMLIDPENPTHMKNKDDCLKAVFELVLKLDGSLSGEHGVGIVKRNHVAMELDEHALRLMHLIKKQIDPEGILNPGKTLPPE
ncbi:MAG: FAD-linked oxidase C-terminal domain-containing protein [Gammaproteobacteria bacterium]